MWNFIILAYTVIGCMVYAVSRIQFGLKEYKGLLIGILWPLGLVFAILYWFVSIVVLLWIIVLSMVQWR